jgi:4-hydroxy-tetrahydrodipicolinate synthase
MPTTQNPIGVTGVVPVIPMPFLADEQIDQAALCRLIDFAVSCGVGAICLPAYGSEFYKLSDIERTEVGGCKKNCVNGHRVNDNLSKEKRWQLTQN